MRSLVAKEIQIDISVSDRSALEKCPYNLDLAYSYQKASVAELETD
jgi:hypothetical protein